MEPLIERLNDRASYDPDGFPVEPRSSLAGDDRASNPYRVSHVLHLCLSAGIDHLHAIKSLILDAGLLHIAAPSSLARGALENFAAASWVLTGQNRDERVERALRWHAKNITDSHRAMGNKAIPGFRTLPERWAALDEVADRRDLGRRYRKGYTSTEAVTAAEEAFSQLSLGVLFPWQLCSGFAHGRPWAFYGATEREELDEDDPGMVRAKLTSNLSIALYPTLAAMELVQEFLRLYNRRARDR